MPRPASDRETIEAEIAHVRSLGLDELHILWLNVPVGAAADL
jgi:hypothetical protein